MWLNNYTKPVLIVHQNINIDNLGQNQNIKEI